MHINILDLIVLLLLNCQLSFVPGCWSLVVSSLVLGPLSVVLCSWFFAPVFWFLLLPSSTVLPCPPSVVPAGHGSRRCPCGGLPATSRGPQRRRSALPLLATPVRTRSPL